MPLAILAPDICGAFIGAGLRFAALSRVVSPSVAVGASCATARFRRVGRIFRSDLLRPTAAATASTDGVSPVSREHSLDVRYCANGGRPFPVRAP